MKEVTLSELSLTLGINKSKLLYWNSKGLLPAPIRIRGKTLIFRLDEVSRAVLRIEFKKGAGESLKDMQRNLSKPHASTSDQGFKQVAHIQPGISL